MSNAPWHNRVMHQLILLRHAKAGALAAGISDHDRPLTEAGRHAATDIASAMRQAGLAPDVVLVSSALRTQQTFRVLEGTGVWEEWPNIDLLPMLYMATPEQIRDTLRETPETVRSVMVIGHNPGIHALALALAGAAKSQPEFAGLNEAYPTAGLTEFLVAAPWRRLGPETSALQRFLRPASLA